MELADYFAEERGRQRRMADGMGITPVLLSQWAGDRQIPEERCPNIEFWSGGLVTCEEQRPDLSWVRVTDPDWPHYNGRPLLDHSVKVAA